MAVSVLSTRTIAKIYSLYNMKTNKYQKIIYEDYMYMSNVDFQECILSFFQLNLIFHL